MHFSCTRSTSYLVLRRLFATSSELPGNGLLKKEETLLLCIPISCDLWQQIVLRIIRGKVVESLTANTKSANPAYSFCIPGNGRTRRKYFISNQLPCSHSALPFERLFLHMVVSTVALASGINNNKTYDSTVRGPTWYRTLGGPTVVLYSS